MTLVPLPALADNYIWMLQKGRDAIEIDPGDATPVFDALGRAPLQLAAILVTHQHADRNRLVREREIDRDLVEQREDAQHRLHTHGRQQPECATRR